MSEEFCKCLRCKGKSYKNLYSFTQKNGPMLLKRINGLNDTNQCTICCKTLHKADDCWSTIKCKHCNKLEHLDNHCHQKKKQKKKDKEALVAQVLTEKLVVSATPKKLVAHVVQLDNKSIKAFAATFDFEDMYNYNYHYASSAMNNSPRMYNWLVDTGSMHHFCNTCNLFSTYEATYDASVLGVRGNHTKTEGHRTIYLAAQHEDHIMMLWLEYVNHISSNKYNIISLA